MGTVEKLVLRVGLDNGGTGIIAGYPDGNLNRSGALIPTSAASWSAALRTRPDNGFNLESIFGPQNFPANPAGKGHIQAITIAPDSPFATVDMYLGSVSERTRHRISVDAPFVGEIQDQVEAFFAIPDAVPLIVRVPGTDVGGAQSARADLTQLWWDSNAPLTPDNGLTGLKYPVRLNVYRGFTTPPILPRKRGEYAAKVSFEIVDVGGAVASQPQLVVLTHGRRRVRCFAGLWANATGAPPPNIANLRVDGVIGRSSQSDDGAAHSDKIDAASYDLLLADSAITHATAAGDSTPLIFDYQGNPYFAHVCTITGGVIGTRGYIGVQAWDD